MIWTCVKHVNVNAWRKAGDGPWVPDYYQLAFHSAEMRPHAGRVRERP